MGFPVLKSGDSYPLVHCLLCSQLCRKWNTAYLLRTSYQIQTQTDRVWLSWSCDLFTPFRKKHQVISELWQQPAGSQHIPGIKIVRKEHQAPVIRTSDSRNPQMAWKMLANPLSACEAPGSLFLRSSSDAGSQLLRARRTWRLGSSSNQNLGHNALLPQRREA